MPQDNCFRLITLGRLTLLRPTGEPEDSLTTRRRKLALLAVLAFARQPVSRDALIEMFWGEQNDEHARHSLSDAMSHLRRMLGRDAITMRHEEVALAPDAPLRIDALELGRAVEAGNFARAVATYGGEFLAQVYVADSSARFEHWADRERDRLRHLFVRACIQECAVLSRDGRWSECAILAERWLDAAPLSVEAAVTLAGALTAPGTRDALGDALAACQRAKARLTREFGLEPDPRMLALEKELSARLARTGSATATFEPPAPAAAAELPVQTEPSIGSLSGDRRTTGERTVPRRLRARGLAPAAIAVVVGIVAVWTAHRRSAAELAAAAASANVVAVLPFRTVAADSSLAYLREGVAELLGSKLTGEIGPRSVDPSTAFAAWRRAGGAERQDLPQEAALEVAERVGAGQLLVGSVVGNPENVVLNASLLAVPGGRVRGVMTVRGPADSLPSLVDRLVAGLLATDAGETGRRLADLTSTSLPALKSYLAGRAAYRRGRTPEAGVQFLKAMELDSTFSLAALGLAMSGGWPLLRESEGIRRSLERAWTLRQRLTARDQTMLVAYVGLNYPARRSGLQELSDWERAVQFAPDSPEAWYEFGDRIFHLGAALSIPDWQRRAVTAFSRASALDSTLPLPYAHLVELAARAGDTAAVRRYLALFEAQGSMGAAADYVRWRAAAALGDTAALTVLRRRMASMTNSSLERIIGMAQLEGVDLADGRRAAEQLYGRAMTKLELLVATTALQRLAVNSGRPREAQRLLHQLRQLGPLPAGAVLDVYIPDQLAVLDALFAEGDQAAARHAATELTRRSRMPLSPHAATRAGQYSDLCTLELWRLVQGTTTSALAAIRQLRSGGTSRDSLSLLESDPALCIAMLDALHKAAIAHPDAVRATERLDSLMATWPVTFGATFANLIVARLRESGGDLPGALAALQRRPIYWTGGARYLSTFLREEGRLAALTGDEEGARRTYRHYLALRTEPEPSLRADLERVQRLSSSLGAGTELSPKE